MNNQEIDQIRNRYNRSASIFAWMDRRSMNKPSKWRKEMIAKAKGRVLEVGVGAGANFAYYSSDISLTGIDFSPNMLQFAREKAQKLKLNADLLEMDVQQLVFPDNTFDYVIATCVFCSVPDPVQGLREIFRVCKPEGKVLLLEHMRSENPLVGKLMDILNPLMVRLSGANINRRTLDNIEQAGFMIDINEDLFATILRRLALIPIKGDEKK